MFIFQLMTQLKYAKHLPKRVTTCGMKLALPPVTMRSMRKQRKSMYIFLQRWEILQLKSLRHWRFLYFHQYIYLLPHVVTVSVSMESTPCKLNFIASEVPNQDCLIFPILWASVDIIHCWASLYTIWRYHDKILIVAAWQIFRFPPQLHHTSCEMICMQQTLFQCSSLA